MRHTFGSPRLGSRECGQCALPWRCGCSVGSGCTIGPAHLLTCCASGPPEQSTPEHGGLGRWQPLPSDPSEVWAQGTADRLRPPSSTQLPRTGGGGSRCRYSRPSTAVPVCASQVGGPPPLTRAPPPTLAQAGVLNAACCAYQSSSSHMSP